MTGLFSPSIHSSRPLVLNVVTSGACLVFLCLCSTVLSAQDRPAEVTDSLVARGERVFHGPANCSSCHGEAGQGTEIAPALTDDEWSRGKGSYGEIVDQILHGVSRKDSDTDTPMPMRGWTGLSDEDVRAVAAYVWSLSHEPQEDGP
jgi:cbb3-type cytochrome c oxidase subunit III